MKRRITAQTPEPNLSQHNSVKKPGINFHAPKKSRKSPSEGNRDTLSAKKLFKTASSRKNNMEQIIGDSIPGKAIAARIAESLQLGIPYSFAATKKGSQLTMRPDTDDFIQNFIESEHPSLKKEEVYFCSFIEQDKPPLILGTPDVIKKTGANRALLNYLLKPQQMKRDLQLVSRVFFKSLIDASGIASFPKFTESLRTNGVRNDVWYAQAELLIDTASAKSPFFLNTLLELGFSANSFSPETGSFAVTVAKLHKREESLKLLAEYGADMNVRERSPY